MPSDELRAARQAQIASAALPLLLDKGFHATSIREIAEAAGLSMGGLYEYITTKDDVLSLVYRQMTATVDEIVTPSGETTTGDVETEIARVLDAYRTRAQEVQVMYRETVALDEAHREALAAGERDNARRVAELITLGIERGELSCDDPLLVGHLVAFLAAFMPLRGWIMRRDGIEPGPETARTLARLVVRALGADR